MDTTIPDELQPVLSRRRTITDLRRASRLTPGSEAIVVDGASLEARVLDVLRTARGVVDPSVALIVLGDAQSEQLEGAGWFLERSSAGAAVYRLPWSDEDFTAAQWRSRGGPIDVVVRLDDHVDARVQAAYRCAVPGSLELAVVVGDEEPHLPLAADAVELVAPAAAFPEPGWVQALLDLAGPEPVGCCLATSAGEVVHAGASASGRAIAAGARVGADPLPEVTVRRRLLPPLVRPHSTGEAPSAVHGTLLGGVAALVAPEAAPTISPAPLREALPGSVLVVSDHLVSPEPPDWLVGYRELGPVVVWTEREVTNDTVEQYGVSGICVVGPWSDVSGVSGVDLGRWVGATRPAVMAYLSAELVERSFEAAASHGAHSTVAWIGVGPCPLPERFDLDVGPGTLVDSVRARPVRLTTDGPRPIVERATKDGLVSVVIPVHGQRQLTEACIDSLRRTVPGDLEIVVVDDASPDDTGAWLARRADLTVVTNESNLGFAASVNRGLDEASGELVCVLNNDTEVVDGWLDAMLAQLAVPGTGMVGPRSNAIAGRQMVRSAPAMTDPVAARAWGAEHAAARAGFGYEVPTLMGLCLLAPRDLFVGLGGLDEGFGLGNGEDAELSERIRRAGLRLRVADGAVVLHHGSATFRSIATDYGSLLLTGNRLTPPALSSRSDRWGIVLSDGQPYGASATVDSLMPLVDRLFVVERGAVHPTELAIGNFACLDAEVVALDWRSQPVMPLVAGQDASVLVFAAGEVPVYEDWGLVRVELESLRDGAATLASSVGPTRRVIPAGEDPLDWVGRHPAPGLRTMAIGA
ncbi:MAG: glycosyltransferase family 2 protein [Actinomycetota bacterium]